MPEKSIKHIIQRLIENGKLEEAIRQLCDYYKVQNQKVFQICLSLSRRLHAIKEELHRGVISWESANVERTKIAEAALTLAVGDFNDSGIGSIKVGSKFNYSRNSFVTIFSSTRMEFLLVSLFFLTTVCVYYIYSKVEDTFVEVLISFSWMIFAIWIFIGILRAVLNITRTGDTFSSMSKLIGREFKLGSHFLLVLFIIANAIQLCFYNKVVFKTNNEFIQIIHDFDDHPEDRLLGSLTAEKPLIIKLAAGEYRLILKSDARTNNVRTYKIVVRPFWKSISVHQLELY